MRSAASRFPAPRFEWSALLATALVLLALTSSFAGMVPAVGVSSFHSTLWTSTVWNAPVAAFSASTSDSCQAALFWLQKTRTFSRTRNSSASSYALTSLNEAAITSSVEIASARRGIDYSLAGEKSTLREMSFDDTNTLHLPFAASGDVPSLASAPRYDATLRLRDIAHSAHEAGFLAGARTNAYLE